MRWQEDVFWRRRTSRLQNGCRERRQEPDAGGRAGIPSRSVVGRSTYPLDFPTVALPRGALSLGQTPFHIPTKMTIPLFKNFT